jgi:hypothetical protein
MPVTLWEKIFCNRTNRSIELLYLLTGKGFGAFGAVIDYGTKTAVL